MGQGAGFTLDFLCVLVAVSQVWNPPRYPMELAEYVSLTRIGCVLHWNLRSEG